MKVYWCEMAYVQGSAQDLLLQMLAAVANHQLCWRRVGGLLELCSVAEHLARHFLVGISGVLHARCTQCRGYAPVWMKMLVGWLQRHWPQARCYWGSTGTAWYVTCYITCYITYFVLWAEQPSGLMLVLAGGWRVPLCWVLWFCGFAH